MVASAYILDPTISDEKSAVRGIGRYIKLLKEYFPTAFLHDESNSVQAARPAISYIDNLKQVPPNGLLINPFLNMVSPPLITKRYARRQVALIHDLIPLKYPKHFPVGLIRGWWYRFKNNQALKYYDHFITDSETSKIDIVQYLKIPSSKITVIYPTVQSIYLPHIDLENETATHRHPFHLENGKETPEFSELANDRLFSNEQLKKVNGDFILYVGDVTWNKNLVTLAQAVLQLNIPCVCVGKAFVEDHPPQKKPNHWLDALYEFKRITNKNPLFVFPGFVSDLDLIALYRKAKINILPSLDEGFGFSFIESGYVSTPSIVTDIPIFREIAGQAGLYAKPADPRDLAQKCAQLLYDNALHERMSIKVFDRAQSYMPARFIDNWTQIIQTLNS